MEKLTHNSTLSSKFHVFLFAWTLLIFDVHCFSVKPNTAGMVNRPLHLSTIDSASTPNSPSWIELPSKEEPEAKVLDGLELIVGRLAMFGATGIMVNEFSTGESIIDQCHDAFQTCVDHL